MPQKQAKTGKAAGTHRDRQKAATRELILDTARTLFESRGFEKTTIRLVAREAGVALGTVMSHFPDKTSLLIASLVEDWNAVLARTLGTLPPEAGFRDQWLYIIGAYYEYYARRPALSRVLLKEMLFASSPAGREIQNQLAQLSQTGIASLEYAKTQGLIRPEVDTALATRAIFAFYLQVLYEGMEREKPDPRQMIQNLTLLIDQFLVGIAP